jgi:hypothetical protein
MTSGSDKIRDVSSARGQRVVTGLRPHRWLIAAAILFAIGLLSSVDAEGQTADFVGDDDDDAELAVPVQPTIFDGILSHHSHDPIGVRPHHKQFALTSWEALHRPAGPAHVILPASHEYVSGVLVGLIPSRAPPSS